MSKFSRKRVSMMIFLLVAVVGGVLLHLSGPMAISDQALVVSGNGDRIVQRMASACNAAAMEAPETGRVDSAIDPRRFSILSWNAHKGVDADWYRDLEVLSREVDFVLLQEAALDTGLKKHLKDMSRQWLLAPAFHAGSREFGILSAGRTPVLSYCAIREPEPLIRIPKMALASTYPMKGMNERLLVINVHMVNFTLGSEVIKHQIESIKKIVSSHKGPVIVAGDFNTWSKDRAAMVNGELKDLGLKPVTFSPDNRVEFFDRKVDGVYYRDLEVTKSLSYEVRTSDHNPLEVHFRLPTLGRS